MIESLMFYAYTFSEIIGFCTIFLIVLLYRRKTSDQMLPLKNLGCFQIFAFGIGMIYFATAISAYTTEIRLTSHCCVVQILHSLF